MSQFWLSRLTGLLIAAVGVLILWVPQGKVRRWFKRWGSAHTFVFWTIKLMALVMVTAGVLIIFAPPT